MNPGIIRQAALAYFSGTGCTRAVAQCFRQQLIKRGIDAVLIDIPFAAPDHLNIVGDADLLMVFSPVYACRLTDTVERWIRSLPPVEGVPAAVISVSGGGEVSPNTACRVHTKRLLARKGYTVVYEKMLVMPSNFAVATPEDTARELLAVLPQAADRVLSDILVGRRRITHPKRTDRFLASVCRAEHLGARFFGASMRVTDDCSRCGWCVSHCPKKNIRLEGDRIRFAHRCMLCLGCVYGCPQKALHPRVMGFAVIPEGFSMARLAQDADPQSDSPASGGALWQGVEDYLREERTAAGKGNPR